MSSRGSESSRARSNLEAVRCSSRVLVSSTRPSVTHPDQQRPPKCINSRSTRVANRSSPFATTLAATNDLFYGPDGGGIALFDANDTPISGDITDQISLWDTGSEGNEEPFIGPNTVTNQLAPNTGTAGEGKVQLLNAVNDGFTYPTVSSLLKVSISAQ